uniref:Uncharacterized protein n=1 Tax=viral metagenome TaxID=1070528 RepID=A0A6C0D7Q2_9ZZZZ
MNPIQRMYTDKESIGTNFLNNEKVGKSSGQQVLLPQQTPPPPRGPRLRKEKVTTILCNSRERNVVSYPNTNMFRWRLRRDLKDITSIRLIGGSLPANLYNINNGWNKFTFFENLSTYTITLNSGYYDATSLAVEVKRALNNSGLSNVYDVTYSSTTLKLTIKRVSGTYNFSILFQSGVYVDNFDDYYGAVDNLSNDYLSEIKSPARILGFITQDYSDSSGTITAPNSVDTAWFLNKLFLHINTETDKEFNRIEIARGPHDPYTIIYLDDVKDGVKFLNKETDYPILEFNPAPLSRLSLLEISIRDEFYKLLDLQNKEFTLLLEITYLE